MTNATATSSGDTKQKEPESRRNDEKKPVDTRITMFSNGDTRGCSSSRRVLGWRPWVGVEPLVRWLEKHGFAVNRVLNEALLFWVGGLGDEELRLKARLGRLLDEERELRLVGRVVLRSGAFLDGYAEKLLAGGSGEDAKLGRKPLKALSREEEPVVRRLLARREEVVKEICQIEEQLLPGEEYVLKSERKPRHRHRKDSRSRDHETKNKHKGGGRSNGQNT